MKLLEYYRSGLVEEEHFGFIKFLGRDGIVSVGDDGVYFLRSCAKPLQASLAIDLGLGLNSEQLAICCGSHAGEEVHLKAVRSVLEKFNISESLLKCGEHQPLSATAQRNLVLNGEPCLQVHNNCSGKHAFMLACCKKMGWDLYSYDELEHPLQQMIKQKVNELCEIDKEYPVTIDGCGVPIFSMPLVNMVRGFVNVFNLYPQLKEACINHPYLIGGENRLDSAVMRGNPHLACKVGAGGLCIVTNLETQEGLIVKIADCDMQARAITVVKCLEDLNWLKTKSETLKEQADTQIKTIKGVVLGEVKPCFTLNTKAPV